MAKWRKTEPSPLVLLLSGGVNLPRSHTTSTVLTEAL